MQQFVFIIANSILFNLLSCIPFGFQTRFSSFSKQIEPFPVNISLVHCSDFKVSEWFTKTSKEPNDWLQPQN